jgi:hypothetical protein
MGDPAETPPRYVRMGTTTLHHQKDHNGRGEYRRVAGAWAVHYRRSADGTYISISQSDEHKHLSGVPLVEIDRATWAADQVGYVTPIESDAPE